MVAIIMNSQGDQLMATKLSEFCTSTMGTVTIEIKSIARLLNDNGAVGDSTLKVLVILSRESQPQIEPFLQKLVYNEQLFGKTTFILNFPHDVQQPEWLEKYGADYIDRRREDMWKRIIGSFFGMSAFCVVI